ncbi:MAG TPA: CoA transferase [Dehalococcoidia bacterium]|nr:CoA transferase [Dehalococcoidia bacterium]
MQPLDGIKVLDVARGYPGSYTTMFLGDFGAEVIRVEPPVASLLPLPGIDSSSAEYSAFNPLNRNKKSIVLNLKNDDGLKVFYKLVEKADVLVEGFRPGVMKRLRADYPTLKELNPKLIYCSLTGFGHDGPYASWPSHDSNYIALAGALSLIGQRDGPPCLPGNFLADMAGAGLHSVIGILLAISARERTGQGQFVDIAYVDTVMSLTTMETINYFFTGQVPRRGETPANGGAPWANVYKCQDGEYIALGCGEPHLWADLCHALGREDLLPYQSPPPEERDRVISSLAETFLTKTRDEWASFFKEKGIAGTPVLYLNETFTDPQVLHRHMLIEVEHPKLGKVRQIGIPIKLSETPGQVKSLGVVANSDTEEILSSLGYTKYDVEEIRQRGALG